MGIINFEWDRDSRGNSILIARKKRGKISISELQEAMRNDYRFQGAWATIFRVCDDGYQGWGGGADPKGDVLELYQIGDGENCPVCAAVFSGIECCPNCGERIKE